MNAAAFVRQMEETGVHLSLTASENIKTAGDDAAVKRWLPMIREHKAAIIEALRASHEASGGAVRSCRWRVTKAGGETVHAHFAHDIKRAEVAAWYLSATVIEPYTPTPIRPDAPMTEHEVAAIRAWLASIEEGDPAAVANVLKQCDLDAGARAYCLRRANEKE